MNNCYRCYRLLPKISLALPFYRAIILLFLASPLNAQSYGVTTVEQRVDDTFVQLQYDDQTTEPLSDLINSTLSAPQDNQDKIAIRVVGGFSPATNQELLDYYAAKIPTELAHAQQASGNLHNPTLAPLITLFPNAFESTSLYREINKALSQQGFRFSNLAFEKYSLSNQATPTRIEVLDIWLHFERHAASE